MTEDDRRTLEIDWLRTVAGALAAVSSAVLLSTLGAAGTIIGAALGSVIVTVGGALYSAGLARSRARLAEAQTLALRRVGVAQAEVRRAGRRQGDEEAVDAHLAHADETLAEAKGDLDDLEPEPIAWRDRFAGLPWRRISLVAAGLFAVTIVGITAFELVAGESVSQITGGTDSGSGGTTVSHIGGSGDGSSSPGDGGKDQPGSSDGASPSAGPTEESTPTPTESPSDEPSDTTPTPSPSPTAISPTLPTESTPSPSSG